VKDLLVPELLDADRDLNFKIAISLGNLISLNFIFRLSNSLNTKSNRSIMVISPQHIFRQALIRHFIYFFCLKLLDWVMTV
jgi:hypothetical protein